MATNTSNKPPQSRRDCSTASTRGKPHLRRATIAKAHSNYEWSARDTLDEAVNLPGVINGRGSLWLSIRVLYRELLHVGRPGEMDAAMSSRKDVNQKARIRELEAERNKLKTEAEQSELDVTRLDCLMDRFGADVANRTQAN